MSVFKSKEFGTSRRFSDFLNLYEKLKEKHLPAGRIMPPAPEKDMIGMAKVKMSKEDATPIDFIEKRRAALQRFLNRLAKHETFRFDPDFRDFIEISDDLPKATNTSALSGASMLKMFKNVTDSVSKIALKMEETDQVRCFSLLTCVLNRISLCFVLNLRKMGNINCYFKPPIFSDFDM